MSWDKQKRKLTRAEMFGEIKTEISLLETFCDLYDNGKHEIAPKIASSIVGLMLNGGRDRDKPCPVNSFGMTPKFLTTMPPISFDNLLMEHPGVAISVAYTPTGSKPSFLPSCKTPLADGFRQWVAQKNWWDAPIIKTAKDTGDKTVSRWKLLKTYRDNRSGAHIDPTTEAIFEHINSSVGWVFVDEGRETVAPRMTVAQAVVRQIAFEALETLHRFENEVTPN